MKKLKLKRLKAFTLVELIIVITILAILATIAFVSFQGYMKGARDSNRVTTITEINKGIETFYTTTGNVPTVDNQIGTGTITGNPVIYVGYVGDIVTKLIKLNKTAIDPVTNANYIYAVDITKTKYQVATIAEDLQTNRGNIITQTYADLGLKARVLGNYQGLLKYNGKIYNIPSLIITFSGSTSQDLLTGSTNYVINKAENLPYLAGSAKKVNTLSPTQILQRQTNTGTILAVTGITLPSDATTWNATVNNLQTSFGYHSDVIGQAVFGDKYFTEIKGNTSTTGGNLNSYPGCDSDDIIVGSYRIAACNVGSSIAGTGVMSYGNYFQWGNNGGTPSGTIIPSTTLVNASANGPGNYYNNTTLIGGESLISPYDWTSSQNNNLWGDITNNSSARQGPCANGYHIPSQVEWSGIISAGGWGTNGPNMGTALKLPFAGFRDPEEGIMHNQVSNGAYWSSSPYTYAAYYLGLESANIYTSSNFRAVGLSVRCFKN